MAHCHLDSACSRESPPSSPPRARQRVRGHREQQSSSKLSGAPLAAAPLRHGQPLPPPPQTHTHKKLHGGRVPCTPSGLPHASPVQTLRPRQDKVSALIERAAFMPSALSDATLEVRLRKACAHACMHAAGQRGWAGARHWGPCGGAAHGRPVARQPRPDLAPSSS